MEYNREQKIYKAKGDQTNEKRRNPHLLPQTRYFIKDKGFAVLSRYDLSKTYKIYYIERVVGRLVKKEKL